MDRELWRERWKTLRIPLLVLALGIGLMLIPARQTPEQTGDSPEEKLETLLSLSSGVGTCRVLISENGVVIVCRGAEDPKVQLEILRAAGSYTGFSSDKITVMKMADQN